MENENPLYGPCVHPERFTLGELIAAELNLYEPMPTVDITDNYSMRDDSPEARDRRLEWLQNNS